MAYTDRFRTPSPHFQQPTETSLEILVQTWEDLRALNFDGYRTSAASPISTWLVAIHWADRKLSRSTGRGTTCSPFTTQSIAMAFSPEYREPYVPMLSDGRALPYLFSLSANGRLSHAPAMKRLMAPWDMTIEDSGWPRGIIFFNLGYAVEPTQMRRGDAVKIDWMNGGGHAVFCWDVHLNAKGEVDAFQYVSSNGSIPNGGSGAGVSVGGTPKGKDGFLEVCEGHPHVKVHKTPLFSDDERYVAEGGWATWDPNITHKHLADCRVPPKRKPTLIKRAKVARLHGVVPPPPFAMGYPAWTPGMSLEQLHHLERQSGSQKQERLSDLRIETSKKPEPKKPEATQEDRGRWLQRRLKALFDLGMLSIDIGTIDGKIGKKSTAAVVEFQKKHGLDADGKAGPKTRGKLEETYQKVCSTAVGQEYLATGRVRPVEKKESAKGEPLRAHGRLYFRHGAVKAGDTIELILHGVKLPDQTFTVELEDARSRTRIALPQPLSIHPKGLRTAIEIALPTSLHASAITAHVAGTELRTHAPVSVLPAQSSAASST